MGKKIVIIGCGAASISAAIAARKTDPDAEITMISRDHYTAYARCGLPFALAKEVPSFEALVDFPMDFYEQMGFNLKPESTVTDVDAKQKRIEFESKKGKETLTYDALIMATGADPIFPPIKGSEKKGIFKLRTIDDGKAIDQAVSKSKKALVVGAGLIGLEVADALVRRGLKVTVVELLPQAVRPLLDEDFAEMVHKRVTERGVRLILNHAADEFLGGDKVEAVLVGGEKIPTDFVVMTIGVRSNTALAQKIGAELGVTKCIRVNSRMETTVKDVYACGDCVESRHLVTGLPSVSQLGTTANRQGKVAGVNAAGGYSVFPGVLSTSVTKFFDMEIGYSGLTEWQAKLAGIEPIVSSVSWKTRAHYHPEVKDMEVKMLFDPDLGVVIGGQIIAGESVAMRINLLSVAISNRMTAFELAKIDAGYAPPLNDAVEPIAMAAESAVKSLKAT